MDGWSWNTIVSFLGRWPIFRGEKPLVSGSFPPFRWCQESSFHISYSKVLNVLGGAQANAPWAASLVGTTSKSRKSSWCRGAFHIEKTPTKTHLQQSNQKIFPFFGNPSSFKVQQFAFLGCLVFGGNRSVYLSRWSAKNMILIPSKI